MIKKIKRAAGPLLAALLTLSACGTAGAPDQGSGASGAEGAAMGRYIEEEYALPGEIGFVFAGPERRADGHIELLANLNPDRIVGPWVIYASADGGKSWQKREAPSLSAFDDATLEGAAFDKDGNLYLCSVVYPPEFDKMLEEALTSGSVPLPEDYPPLRFHRVAADGAVSELPIVLEAEEGQLGQIYVSELVAPDDGSLVVRLQENYTQFEPDTGAVKNQFITGDGNAIAFGDTLAVSTQSGVEQYSLSSGETLETIALDEGSGHGQLSLSADGKSLYRCDSSGIYRWVLGGSMWERVVDGSLTSLSMPSVWISGMCEKADGDFLVLSGSGDDYIPINFHYSADTPTTPSTAMTVYSLRDNDTVRQAMGVFQRQNPDIRVDFTAAVDGASAVTQSDAVRSLNTELLAGKGPDVLILDGLPVQSYMEKGVLLDLSALRPKLESGEVLANIAGTYGKDGALHAVPLRFAVPHLWGGDDMLAAAKDLSSLADWIASDHQKNPGQRQLYQMKPEELIATFIYTCAPAWQGDGGDIDPALFEAFITDIKKIADTAVEPKLEAPFEPAMFEQPQNFDTDGMYWVNHYINAVVGLSKSMDDLASPDAAVKYLGSGGFALLPGQAQNVYVPQVVLGVNKASKMPEKAMEFVETALTERVQSIDFGDGYPVNLKALESAAAYPYSEDDDGKQGFLLENGELKIFQILWPSETFMQSVIETYKGLSTPSTLDPVLMEMIVDETRGYFEGSKSAGEVASAVAQRTKAYLAE